MLKKDYWYAAAIGLITAFFARLLLINTEVMLAYGNLSLPLWSLFIILPIAECAAYVIASKLFSHILVLKQLGRFGIVGLMNVCVDIGIATSLRRAYAIDPLNAADMLPVLVVASSIAIVNSYFWQRMWTFAEKAPPSRKEFISFVIVTLIGLAINTAIAFLAIQGISALDGLQEDRVVTLSKILATVVSLFWNFLGYKFIVFK